MGYPNAKYDYEALAMEEMEKSPCEKRKVGCLLVDEYGEIVGRGHNHNDNNPCEDHNGETVIGVVHAEIRALADANSVTHDHLMHMSRPIKAYVTHQPCQNCLHALRSHGIQDIIIVDRGIKHDAEKLKLSLIPTQLINGVGEVMQFGAKKYKRNNWKNLDDPTRYLDALMRHLEAYRRGEEFDEETGLPHMAHLATNAGFLLFFDEERSGWQEENGLWI